MSERLLQAPVAVSPELVESLAPGTLLGDGWHAGTYDTAISALQTWNRLNGLGVADTTSNLNQAVGIAAIFSDFVSHYKGVAAIHAALLIPIALAANGPNKAAALTALNKYSQDAPELWGEVSTYLSEVLDMSSKATEHRVSPGYSKAQRLALAPVNPSALKRAEDTDTVQRGKMWLESGVLLDPGVADSIANKTNQESQIIWNAVLLDRLMSDRSGRNKETFWALHDSLAIGAPLMELGTYSGLASAIRGWGNLRRFEAASGPHNHYDYFISEARRILGAHNSQAEALADMESALHQIFDTEVALNRVVNGERYGVALGDGFLDYPYGEDELLRAIVRQKVLGSLVNKLWKDHRGRLIRRDQKLNAPTDIYGITLVAKDSYNLSKLFRKTVEAVVAADPRLISPYRAHGKYFIKIAGGVEFVRSIKGMNLSDWLGKIGLTDDDVYTPPQSARHQVVKFTIQVTNPSDGTVRNVEIQTQTPKDRDDSTHGGAAHYATKEDSTQWSEATHRAVWERAKEVRRGKIALVSGSYERAQTFRNRVASHRLVVEHRRKR